MPKVAGKHYAYTPAGKAAAAKAAKQKGVTVEHAGYKRQPSGTRRSKTYNA